MQHSSSNRWQERWGWSSLFRRRHGEAFETPNHCWAQMLLSHMQGDLEFIRAPSGGGGCGRRCLHVDDVSDRIFSRSFRKYMKGAKVSFPNLPKHLFGLPEVRDKQLTNVSKTLWKSPTQQPSAVLLWSCFAASQSGLLVWIKGGMNSALYQEVLKRSICWSALDLNLTHCGIMHQGCDSLPKGKVKSKFCPALWRCSDLKLSVCP